MAQALEYVVGTSPVPHWLKGRILPYKRMDGEIGYELKYRRGHMFFAEELQAGDSIIRYGDEMYIQRNDFLRRDDETRG